MKSNVNPAAISAKGSAKPSQNPAQSAPTRSTKHPLRKATGHNTDMKFDGGLASYEAGGKHGTKE